MNRYEGNNKLLEMDKNPYDYQGVFLAPALFLNGVLVREEIDPDISTTAICSKLATRPKICKEIVENIKWKDNYVNLK